MPPTVRNELNVSSVQPKTSKTRVQVNPRFFFYSAAYVEAKATNSEQPNSLFWISVANAMLHGKEPLGVEQQPSPKQKQQQQEVSKVSQK